MTRSFKSAALPLAILFAAACASKSPAPEVAMAGDISALNGHWEGVYSSEVTGRKGTIVFDLKPGDKVARGDVLMVPQGAKEGATSGPEAAQTMPQVLDISFVSAAAGVVRGTMAPYRDPACDCEVQTTFVGTISGDTVSGTYSTAPTGTGKGGVATGTWKIARAKK
jgi:hypothetical protein